MGGGGRMDVVVFAKGVIVELLLIMANVNNQNDITTAFIESLCIFAIFKCSWKFLFVRGLFGKLKYFAGVIVTVRN